MNTMFSFQLFKRSLLLDEVDLLHIAAVFNVYFCHPITNIIIYSENTSHVKYITRLRSKN